MAYYHTLNEEHFRRIGELYHDNVSLIKGIEKGTADSKYLINFGSDLCVLTVHETQERNPHQVESPENRLALASYISKRTIFDHVGNKVPFTTPDPVLTERGNRFRQIVIDGKPYHISIAPYIEHIPEQQLFDREPTSGEYKNFGRAVAAWVEAARDFDLNTHPLPDPLPPLSWGKIIRNLDKNNFCENLLLSRKYRSVEGSSYYSHSPEQTFALLTEMAEHIVEKAIPKIQARLAPCILNGDQYLDNTLITPKGVYVCVDNSSTHFGYNTDISFVLVPTCTDVRQMGNVSINHSLSTTILEGYISVRDKEIAREELLLLPELYQVGAVRWALNRSIKLALSDVSKETDWAGKMDPLFHLLAAQNMRELQPSWLAISRDACGEKIGRAVAPQFTP